MQPIILITLHRRYRELIESLETVKELEDEFDIKPKKIVVWADPCIGHYWILRQLLQEEKIDYLVLRNKSVFDGEGKPTSYPESLNIKKGFEFIEENFKDYFVIVKASDVFPRPGIFEYINKKIKDVPAILFFWENRIEKINAWNTCFFAVRHDFKEIPPVSNNSDTLEINWGKMLASKKVAFERNHNSRDRKFYCKNYQEAFPIKPLYYFSSISCFVVGYRRFSIFRFIKNMVCSIVRFFKPK